MSDNIFKGVVKLSQAHYDELKADGTLTVGDKTITYDPNVLYVTPSQDAKTDLTIENVEGNSITFTVADSNKHKVFNITNQCTITLNDTSTNCNEYSFELTTSSYSNNNITMNYIGCEGPMNFEFETYTTYIGKIINGKVCYISKFDSYPNKWIYGVWLSSNLQTRFTFDNIFNFEATINGTTKTGTYSIENGMLSLNIDGGSVEIKALTKVSDTQITIDGYGTLNK